MQISRKGLLNDEKTRRLEAARLMQKTRIPELMKCVGEVSVGGAYEYQVMYDRDIDVEVVLSSRTKADVPAVRAKILALVARTAYIQRIKMVDFLQFHSDPGKPVGIWLGLTVPSGNHDWNMDIWFFTETRAKRWQRVDLPPSVRSRLGALSDSERAIILALKQSVAQLPAKEIPSALIYLGVLKAGVRSMDDLATYVAEFESREPGSLLG